jgi:hypothetical protein
MKSIPKDDATLDAYFKAISGETSLAAHIANASLPNSADSHDSEKVVERYKNNVKRYVGSVIRAGRRFHNR